MVLMPERVSVPEQLQVIVSPALMSVPVQDADGVGSVRSTINVLLRFVQSLLFMLSLQKIAHFQEPSVRLRVMFEYVSFNIDVTFVVLSAQAPLQFPHNCDVFRLYGYP